MPNAQYHISKAERNEDFYQKPNLDTSPFNEWAVVVLFYISMHYIDAVLGRDTQLNKVLRDPQTHFTRKAAISKCSDLAPIASMYLNLYDRSRDARYNKICFPSSYLHRLETFSSKPVRNYLRKKLGLP